MDTAIFPVSTNRDGDRFHLTLNRPSHGNALDPATIKALDAGLSAAEQSGCAVLVLRGAGKHFCTGFDFSDIETTPDAELILRFVRIELLFQRMMRTHLVTVAVGQGRVFGAGADLFAACDHRVVADDARLAFPGAGFGLLLGTARLMARIGAEPARRLVESGAPVDAREAVSLGLAHASAPLEDMARVALEAGPVRLDETTSRALYFASRPQVDERSLSDLVKSAARPGLAQRMRAYRQATLKARTPPA